MKLAFRSGCRCRPPPANLHACVQATRCSGSLTGSLALRFALHIQTKRPDDLRGIALACHSDSVFKGRSLVPNPGRNQGLKSLAPSAALRNLFVSICGRLGVWMTTTLGQSRFPGRRSALGTSNVA